MLQINISAKQIECEIKFFLSLSLLILYSSPQKIASVYIQKYKSFSHNFIMKKSRNYQLFTLFKQAVVVRYGHLGFFFLLEVLDDLTFFHDNQPVAVFEGILHLVGNHEGRQLVSADKVVS